MQPQNMSKSDATMFGTSIYGHAEFGAPLGTGGVFGFDDLGAATLIERVISIRDRWAALEVRRNRLPKDFATLAYNYAAGGLGGSVPRRVDELSRGDTVTPDRVQMVEEQLAQYEPFLTLLESAVARNKTVEQVIKEVPAAAASAPASVGIPWPWVGIGAAVLVGVGAFVFSAR